MSLFPSSARQLQLQINKLNQRMSEMSDATGTEIAHIRASVDATAQSVGGVVTDLTEIKAQIAALKASQTSFSAEDQAALDALDAAATSAMTNAANAKAQADAMVPPAPAVP